MFLKRFIGDNDINIKEQDTDLDFIAAKKFKIDARRLYLRIHFSFNSASKSHV